MLGTFSSFINRLTSKMSGIQTEFKLVTLSMFTL